MIAPKFQLHVSGLNTLSKCGIQFERRYIRGEKLAPSASAVIGTGVDRSITADLGSKIRTGRLLPVDELTDIARETVREEWKRGVVVDDEFASCKSAEETAANEAQRLAVAHHQQFAPRLEPTHVQREWVIDVEGNSLQLAGTIDIQEGSKSIWDTKTSGKSPSADEAHGSLQLTTYSLAAKVIDGTAPERVGLNYLVRLKSGPKLVQLESVRTDADYGHLLERIGRAEQVMQAGLFTPAPLDAWWCSAKWCGYHATCKYARRPVSAAVPEVA